MWGRIEASAWGGSILRSQREVGVHNRHFCQFVGSEAEEYRIGKEKGNWSKVVAFLREMEMDRLQSC
jgi:hypothetical protein